MIFKTLGDPQAPAVLFFHAMGVTGGSSEPVAQHLQDKYFCILPTSTVYCAGQKYKSKADEVRQVEDFLRRQGVKSLALVVASSIGADLAMAFLTQTKLPVGHVFFDGGQFARIGQSTRRLMTPFLYLAIKSLYWSKGRTLKKLLWCDDASIKPYFIAAGRALTYGSLRRQLSDSLEDKPFPRCRRRCKSAPIFPSAAQRIISNIGMPSCKPTPTAAIRCSRAMTTCSTRSATPAALRRCSAGS